LLVRVRKGKVYPKYPIIDPRTGRINIKGLIAAAARAYLNNHREVFKKALQLLKSNFKVGLRIGNKVYTVVGNKIVKLPSKGIKHVKVR
jgi:hypothetical protein